MNKSWAGKLVVTGAGNYTAEDPLTQYISVHM